MHSQGCQGETLIKNLLNIVPTHLIRMPICNQEAKSDLGSFCKGLHSSHVASSTHVCFTKTFPAMPEN